MDEGAQRDRASTLNKRTVFGTGTIGKASCGFEIGRGAPLYLVDIISKSGIGSPSDRFAETEAYAAMAGGLVYRSARWPKNEAIPETAPRGAQSDGSAHLATPLEARVGPAR